MCKNRRTRIVMIIAGAMSVVLFVVMIVVFVPFLSSGFSKRKIRMLAEMRPFVTSENEEEFIEYLSNTSNHIEPDIRKAIEDSTKPVYGRRLLIEVLGRRKTPEAKRALISILENYPSSAEDFHWILSSVVQEVYEEYGISSLKITLMRMAEGDDKAQYRALALITYSLMSSEVPLEQYRDVLEVLCDRVNEKTGRIAVKALIFTITLNLDVLGKDYVERLVRIVEKKENIWAKLYSRGALINFGDRSSIRRYLEIIAQLEKRRESQDVVQAAKEEFDSMFLVEKDKGPFSIFRETPKVLEWIELKEGDLRFDPARSKWIIHNN